MTEIQAYTVVERTKGIEDEWVLEGYAEHYGLYATPELAQQRINELNECSAIFHDYEYRVVPVTITVPEGA